MAARPALPEIDNRQARHLFLHRHGLADSPAGPGKGADLAQVIDTLGFVQLDSVNTLARAHDMILYARRPAYRPGHLSRLYAAGGLFEHWTHDAAVIPMAFYPHWQLRFARDAARLPERWRNWHKHDFEAEFDGVLRHIRDNGPCGSGDLGGEDKKGSSGWWDWHPSKTALEFLWRSGALTVIGRDGFQKRYDLTERVIEETLRGQRPEPEQTIDWLCNGALDRLGFATSGELAAFWDTVTPDEARNWCAREAAAGRIMPAVVRCADGAARKLFLRPGVPDETPPEPTGRLRVLSPFDPALRDRARAQRLFGFHYRIEIFVPAPKRRYGYYVFPLLEGDRLVGRVDMKAERDSGRLRVTALWPERGVGWGKGRQARFEAELDRLNRFAGLTETVFEPGWLRDPL
ncbi:winged helix-turn-helix domain-containing protein [Marinibacterium sp. SX1]|uniref:winged helix-turn-helix domain-containing protein n=1 Tax=Marinibacterium sp. SX1 TaxID=3388424 RepID=UPI003D171A32